MQYIEIAHDIQGNVMSEAEACIYLIGRKTGQLQEPFQAIDHIFGADRLDRKYICDADFKHCTFSNVSFKEAIINRGAFLNCIFIGCYFRRAELVNSSFTGCRFIDCQFAHIIVKSCRFSYSSFRHCQIAIEELEHSLPPEPNIREALTRNLSIESSRLGLADQARLYRMAEIKAREQHLKAAIEGRSQWYLDHFDGLARMRACIKLSLSLLNRWLWGYGERISVLFRNFIIASFAIFPVSLYLVRDGLRKENSGSIELSDLIYFSLENIIPSGIRSGVEAIGFIPRALAAIESVFGIVVLALFAAYIFRWSLHR